MNLAPILVNIVLFMYKSDFIVDSLVIVMLISRLVKCPIVYDSACGSATSVQSLGMLALFSSFLC